MEEHILKMIRNIDVYYDACAKCQIDGRMAAKEIADNFERFIGWFDKNVLRIGGIYRYQCRDKTNMLVNFEDISELYTYWDKNFNSKT